MDTKDIVIAAIMAVALLASPVIGEILRRSK